MITDGILKISENRFLVCVQIQDGVEQTECTSFEDAKKTWKSWHKSLNGGNFRKLKTYAVRQVVVDEVYEIKM